MKDDQTIPPSSVLTSLGEPVQQLLQAGVIGQRLPGVRQHLTHTGQQRHTLSVHAVNVCVCVYVNELPGWFTADMSLITLLLKCYIEAYMTNTDLNLRTFSYKPDDV